MYFSRYFRLTGAVADNIAVNEQIPRIGILSVQSYLRAPKLLQEHHSLLPRTNVMTTLSPPPANPDISVALKVILIHLRAIRRRRILYIIQ